MLRTSPKSRVHFSCTGRGHGAHGQSKHSAQPQRGFDLPVRSHANSYEPLTANVFRICSPRADSSLPRACSHSPAAPRGNQTYSPVPGLLRQAKKRAKCREPQVLRAGCGQAAGSPDRDRRKPNARWASASHTAHSAGHAAQLGTSPVHTPRTETDLHLAPSHTGLSGEASSYIQPNALPCKRGPPQPLPPKAGRDHPFSQQERAAGVFPTAATRAEHWVQSFPRGGQQRTRGL